MNFSHTHKSPRGARVVSVSVKGRRLLVLSSPLKFRSDVLTEAEEAVARLAAGGLTNKEIASRRDRSVRTVAKQLSAVYRKLGVQSREDLAGILSRGGQE